MSGKIITVSTLIVSSILIILFSVLGFKWPISLWIFFPLIVILATYIGFTSYEIDQCRKTGSTCSWGDAYKFLYQKIKSELSKL